MAIGTFRLSLLVVILAAAAGCGESAVEPTPNTPPPVAAAPPPAPVIAVSVPTLAAPPPGAVAFGWPTFTVNNASKTNTTNTLVYRFDFSNREDFATVAFSATVSEGPGQTSYTPPATQAPPSEGTLYWRALAADQANAVQSSSSPAQSFVYFVDTDQNRLATAMYGSLWTGARPSGVHGRAQMGPGWAARTLRSFDGVTFQSPPLETLRLYDLLDLGYDPDGAINWLRSNGYPASAVWYPGPAAIGFPFQYMALIRGQWELVTRVGA